MLGNIGFPELLVIMVVVLLVFGAKRLPEIGSSLGKGIREFKKSIKEVQSSVEENDRLPPGRAADEGVSRMSEPAKREGEPKKLSE
jgi:sec-independent protein translocase protein TatA